MWRTRWVPTFLMFADGLTNISPTLRQTMSDWLQSPYVKLTDGEGPKKSFGVLVLCFQTPFMLGPSDVQTCMSFPLGHIQFDPNGPLCRILEPSLTFAVSGKKAMPPCV